MDSSVRVWEEDIRIPTYITGAPDKNPMFLEKRVYQGSSGVVYPHAVIDKVFDEKKDRIYHALFLENQYLKIMILPELGGRIQMAMDKTNQYHFVYYNRVIKPALVGLAGPWISGGIEFNWPQHHRPSTFEPVDFNIEAYPDGSKTVWVSETEQMFHTKGMAGFTLYPGKACLEIKGRLYNRTPLPQTFLWWANPAVSVDETYQSVFPPDVHAVYDHGKRDVSSFPIATGTYYKVDYSPGTDISCYRNIPVPTSYMAVNSVFDFVGGYNHGKKAGIIHIANHHISPGKKQWTWGCGEFGKAWDRQLTDADGPYFELMTGMFTDNQPDFSWIMPNEERNFVQYFMPYKNIGNVKNATIDAMVNLETDTNRIAVKVYVTAARDNLNVELRLDDVVLFKDTVSLSPEKTYERDFFPEKPFETDRLCVIVTDHSGNRIVQYQPVTSHDEVFPDPASPIDSPEQIKTNEELYLAGLHLEQYRHATFSPIAYYEEALRRDPSDMRNNNAMGLWYLRRGQYAKAEPYFRKAVNKMVSRNPNPLDSEPFYNLGLSLFQQQKYTEASAAFYKTCWNSSWQDNGTLYLARIETIRKNYKEALDLCERSLIRNVHGFHARHLKTALLRKLERYEEAETLTRATLDMDSFQFGSGNEMYLILMCRNKSAEARAWLQELEIRMRHVAHNYIETAIDYGSAGLYDEAISLLNRVPSSAAHPMTGYYLAYYLSIQGNHQAAVKHAQQAFLIETGPYFTNRTEDIDVLKSITILNTADYKAWYYLGNIWYDKRQYDEAITAWEKSVNIFDKLPTVHRNLGIACYNRRNNPDLALQYYKKAFSLDHTDSRILFEMDQLLKRLNASPAKRLDLLESNMELIDERDDLYIEYITLLNIDLKLIKALKLLTSRKFHPWEGGEGKVTAQYEFTHICLAKKAIEETRFKDAVGLLLAAKCYPPNLAEGKLYGAPENDIYYWLGCAYEGMGDHAQALTFWEKASTGPSDPAPAVFYNDHQPDKIFYQGLAWIKLDQVTQAQHCFSNLINYGLKHLNDEVKIDYFAVSLPDLLIFDDDLNKRNRIHCLYLSGLGKLGLGENDEACMYFDKVLELENCHQGALNHRCMALKENSNCIE